MKDEALKLALEALELVNIEFVCNGAHHAKKDRHELGDECPVTNRYRQSIIAIKEALAQEQEPVCDKDPQGCWNVRCQLGNKCRNTSLQSKEPEQEPVAWMTPDGEGFRIRFSPPVNDVPLGWDALYTTPPQRTWVGLTNEDIDQGLLRSNHALQTAGAWRDGVEWATKQLREKNNG